MNEFTLHLYSGLFIMAMMLLTIIALGFWIHSKHIEVAELEEELADVRADLKAANERANRRRAPRLTQFVHVSRHMPTTPTTLIVQESKNV